MSEQLSRNSLLSAGAETTKTAEIERGRRWGAFFKQEGRDYGRLNYGHYPSCPNHRGTEECGYCQGYEEGFNGR